MESDWKRDVFERLIAPIDELRGDSARELVLQHLPTALFRFRAPSPQTINNLRAREEWFSAPRHFNDPFDSSIDVGSLERLVRRISQAGRSLLSKARLADEGIMSALDHAVKAEAGRAASWASRALTEQSREGLRVCCFAENLKSIAMWSHYADAHRGFALEYDFTKLSRMDPRNRCIYPVIYSKEVFDAQAMIEAAFANRSALNIHLPTAASLVKSSDWEYEVEWRIVYPLGGTAPGFASLMPEPQNIYLGCDSAPEFQAEVTEIVRDREVGLFRMVRESSTFSLGIEPVLR